MAEAAKDESVSVRRAVLLAYRQKGKAAVERFLDDADAGIVLEAARAINDVPINEAMPKLATLIERRGLSEPLGYRVLNANFRLGKPENAKAIARFAGRSGEKESLRVEAVRELELWGKPPGRDRIMGVWRPLPSRPQEDAVAAFKASLGGIVSGPGNVRKEAARVAVKLGIKDVGPALFDTVADAKQPAIVRAETLLALHALKDERLDKAVKLALDDKEPRVRAAGRRVLAATAPKEALLSLTDALDKGEVVEKQEAFDVLGGLKGDDAERLLIKWLDRLIKGHVPAEARLDLVESAERFKSDAVRKKLAEYEKARAKDEPFGQWRESMHGGDAESGRLVFLHKAEVSCLRCHKAGGEGTGEVGPDLSGVGAQQKRDYLLESIVFPNKQIAKGYETVELLLDNGKTVSGILKAEDNKEVRLMNAEGAILTVKKDRIEERRRGKSAMPEDLTKHLSRRELRDLVEFLASLKQPAKKTN
jgi:quinoprotein glucose dehydrogenase